jgi:VCBS repeat-containing protein
MALEGKQLGRYRIVRLLGSGGMGEVYLAEDPRINQQVAIKVVRAEQSPYPNAPADQKAARLFQREARAIVALDHPHILPLNDYGEEPQGKTSLIYLVMPYRPEGSLVDWVQQRYPERVPSEVVAHLVSQAAEAIQHAHDHQIIHMDVKPSNFLIRTNSKTPDRPDLLLADFGIAHIASATASTSQAIRGTPTYMAPEQCEGEAVLASDQYALAVLAYELLTGRPPFQGTSMRIMYQHVHTPPEPPSTYNPRLSTAVDDVLLTALAKRPEERFKSVTAFAVAFTNAVQALQIAEADTRISAGPLPKLTDALPDPPLISDTLADAPTRITPSAAEAAPLVSGGLAEETAAPAAQGWAAASTAPTAPPLPETVDLGLKKASGHITPAVPQGWTEETGAPTALPLPDTLSLDRDDAADVADGAAGAKHSRPVAAPAPAPSGPVLAAGRRRSGKRRLILIAAAILLVLTLVAGGGAYVLPRVFGAQGGATGGATSAKVTITPASKDVSNTYTLSAVTGTPDPSKQQVQARMLSTTTPKQTKTVNATGYENIPGTHAHGTIEVQNYDPSNPLNFSAGDTIAPQGTMPPPYYGTLMFDASVSLPPDPGGSTSNPPTAFVPGHVVEIGADGNLPPGSFAGDLYATPNGLYPEVFNPGSFTGGQDPYNGPDVQQSDIDNAANSLISANQPNPQQVFQSQIQPNEQLAGTPQCKPKESANHKAGDRVAQVTVTVSFACSGEVYDHDGALAMAANLLTQQAAADPGGGYALVGTITSAVTNAVVGAQNMVTLTVRAQGVWAYQFSEAQKQTLAQLIAGTTIQAAQQILSSQKGVAQATVQVGGGNGQSLPSDPAKITIVVLTVPGA